MSETKEGSAPTVGRRKFLAGAIAAVAAATAGTAAVLGSNSGTSGPTIDSETKPQVITDIELDNLSEQEKVYLKKLNDLNRQIRENKDGANPEEASRATLEAYRLAFDRRTLVKDWMKQYPESVRPAIRHASNTATRQKLESEIKDKPPDYLPRSFQIPKDYLVEQEVDNWQGTLSEVVETGGRGPGASGRELGLTRIVNGQQVANYLLLEKGQPKPVPLGHVRVISGIAMERTLLPDQGAVKSLSP